MELNTRWRFLICLTATFAVLLAFVLHAVVVGIFFILPYFSDCEPSFTQSPLESSCLSSSARSTVFNPPPICDMSRNYSFQISYCSQTGCAPNISSIGCSAPHCCCRSIPRTKSLTCMGNKFEVSIDEYCVYATCERTIHSVLVQIYNTTLSGLCVRIGIETRQVNSNNTATFPDMAEGEYQVTIRNSSMLLSTEYFHASRLTIDFNSPSGVVYVVYVKRLDTTFQTTNTISTHMVTSPNPIATTQFSNTASDLLTLPNNYFYNGTLFIPKLIAYTSSLQPNININISTNSMYSVYQYTMMGTWSLQGSGNTMLASQENGILWALANETGTLPCLFYLDTVGTSLSVDRGSLALVHMSMSRNGIFASWVTLYNRIVSIPVINDTLTISYVTSAYSQISNNAIITDTVNSGVITCVRPHSPRNLPTAILSETNSLVPTQYCYQRINRTNAAVGQTFIFSILVRNSDGISSFSTLETNARCACVRYPCNSEDTCEVSATVKSDRNTPAAYNSTCSMLGQYRLRECNADITANSNICS